MSTPEADTGVPPPPQAESVSPSASPNVQTQPTESTDDQDRSAWTSGIRGGCLVIVLLVILASLLGLCSGGGGGDGTTTEPAQQESEGSQAQQEEPEPEPEPEPIPEPETITLSGTGQQATEPFDLESGLVVFNMEHQGQGNFAVELLDESGEPVDLPANVIGSFNGSSAVGVTDGTYLLDITADGPWAINIQQPRAAEAPETRSFEGQGAVATNLFSLPGGLVRFEMSHSGQGNFAVTLLDADGNPVALPANDIGNFEGSAAETVSDGIYIMDVEADGPWSISLE